MATQSTEITFTTAESTSAKNVTFTDTATFGGSDLTWGSSDNRVLVKIVDPQGSVYYNNTDVSSPDIDSGGGFTSINLPKDNDSNVIRGEYVVTLTYFDANDTPTQFERSYKYDNSYSSPKASLDLTYSVINPIYFKSVDNTDYDYLTFTPSLSRVHKLIHPSGLGTYSVTTKDLNTQVFYYSTNPKITSEVTLTTTATYTFNGYYTDATSVNVEWTLIDVINGSNGIYVSGGSDGCDLFCCMKSLEERVQNAIDTGNKTDEIRLTSIFNRASNLWQLVKSAYDCGKSADAATYTQEIKDLLDCDGGCGSTGSVSQVVGIGTTPNITRLGVETMTSNVSNYTFENLKNYNYSDGDVILTIDGNDAASIDGYNISLNSTTGKVDFGTTVYEGTKVAYHIIKP